VTARQVFFYPRGFTSRAGGFVEGFSTLDFPLNYFTILLWAWSSIWNLLYVGMGVYCITIFSLDVLQHVGEERIFPRWVLPLEYFYRHVFFTWKLGMNVYTLGTVLLYITLAIGIRTIRRLGQFF